MKQKTPRQRLIALVSDDLWLHNDYTETYAQMLIEEMLRGGYVSSYDAEILATYRPIYLQLSDQGVTRLINETIRRAKSR